MRLIEDLKKTLKMGMDKIEKKLKSVFKGYNVAPINIVSGELPDYLIRKRFPRCMENEAGDKEPFLASEHEAILANIKRTTEDYEKRSILGKCWQRLIQPWGWIGFCQMMTEMDTLKELYNDLEKPATKQKDISDVYSKSLLSNQVSFWDRIKKSWRWTLHCIMGGLLLSPDKEKTFEPENSVPPKKENKKEEARAEGPSPQAQPVRLSIQDQIDQDWKSLLEKLHTISTNRGNAEDVQGLWKRLLEMTLKKMQGIYWSILAYSGINSNKEALNRITESITKLRRKLALRYHPDKEKEKEEIMKSINESYIHFKDSIKETLKIKPEWIDARIDSDAIERAERARDIALLKEAMTEIGRKIAEQATKFSADLAEKEKKFSADLVAQEYRLMDYFEKRLNEMKGIKNTAANTRQPQGNLSTQGMFSHPVVMENENTPVTGMNTSIKPH